MCRECRQAVNCCPKLSQTPQQAQVAAAAHFDTFLVKAGTKLIRIKPEILFEKLDADQSGGLSPSEFRKLLTVVDRNVVVTKELFSECWRMVLGVTRRRRR